MKSGYFSYENALLTVEQTRLADQMTIQSSKTGFELLSEAGQQVYEALHEITTSSDRILIACGNGNNGGDGLVAAKLLLNDGLNVCVALLGSPDAVTGDARRALNELNHSTVDLIDTNINGFTIIVDALLGTGIVRPVTGELADWIHSANESDALIVSIDLPSGISGDSGAVLGAAVLAQHTITFFKKKPGHVLFPGRHHCGSVQVRQIGISEAVLDELQPTLYENNRSLWQQYIPKPAWHYHKYTRGHVVVVTGDATSTGAARLAARATLRTGAGLATLVCPSTAADTVASQVTCEMVKAIDTAEGLQKFLANRRISTVVLGPGMGVGIRTQQLVRVALNSSASVVLDADALTSFENNRADLYELIKSSDNEVVITPHNGEFHRLFGSADQLALPNSDLPEGVISSSNKVLMCKEAAILSGATVVFKGPDTVIANSAGRCVINSNAPVWLATAGSGDVLAGTIAGLLAQGVNEIHSACIGCWMHAEAANTFGPGLIATDIAEQYPSIHRQLFGLNDIE